METEGDWYKALTFIKKKNQKERNPDLNKPKKWNSDDNLVDKRSKELTLDCVWLVHSPCKATFVKQNLKAMER